MTELAIIHNHPIHYQHLLFTELARQGLGFEVFFSAARAGNRIENPLPVNGEYRYRTAWEGSYETAPPMRVSRAVWRSLDELKPRVVVLGGWNDAAVWTGWAWALRNRAPMILWAESNAFDRPRSAWKELPKRLFVSRCGLAHVYGSSNAEYLRMLGMPAEHIYGKRALVDTELYLKGGEARKPAHRTLLYVGRFSPEKNLSGLLRAFAGLRQDPLAPRLILDLVGYGPEETALRHQASELELGGLVRFRGQFPQAELPAIYRSADAFVLPSLSEPWGLVVNEAMLSGLPVLVSTRCGCAADLVRPGNGWTFAPGDVAVLTALLNRVAEMPAEKLAEMGASARLLASEYSPQNSAKTVVAMVRRLVSERGGDAVVRYAA